MFCKVLLLSFRAGHEQNVAFWWLKNLSVLNMFASLGIGMSKNPLYSSCKYNTFLCSFSLSDFLGAWESVGVRISL